MTHPTTRPARSARPLTRRALLVGMVLLVALCAGGPALAHEVADAEQTTSDLNDTLAEPPPAAPGAGLDAAQACQQDTGGPCNGAQAAQAARARQADAASAAAQPPAPTGDGTGPGGGAGAAAATAVSGAAGGALSGGAGGALSGGAGAGATGGAAGPEVAVAGSGDSTAGGGTTGGVHVAGVGAGTGTGDGARTGSRTAGKEAEPACDRGMPAGGQARAECTDAALTAALAGAAAQADGAKGDSGPLYELAFSPSLAPQLAPTATPPPPNSSPYPGFHPDGVVFLSRQAWGAPEAKTRANILTDDRWGFSDAVQKIVIHHTDVLPTDQELATDPAAYMRRLWNSETQLHEVEGKLVKYTDLTYNYVILPNGWVAEGRSSSDGTNAGGTRYPGEDDQGRVVKGAGVPGLNGGLLHVALACDCEHGQPTDAQMAALKALLVELDKHYHLDPEGTDDYRNPTTGVEAKGLHNVCAHKDFNPTTGEHTLCPGRNLYQQLDQVRAEVRKLCAPECLTKPGQAAPTAGPTATAADEPGALPTAGAPAPGAPTMGTRDFGCGGGVPGTWTASWRVNVPVDVEADGQGGYIVSDIHEERAGASVNWVKVLTSYDLLPGSGATAVASADGHSVTVTAKLRIRKWVGWSDQGVQEVTCSATQPVTP